MTAQILQFTDINTEVNHEPRILDVRLAEALGFNRPSDIRELIERHKEALERFGELFRTVRKTKGRPATENYLNEKQAIYICTKSETENATEITIHVVETFYAVRHGGAQPSLLELRSSTITSSEQQTLRELIQRKVEAGGVTYPEAWERLKRKFRVAKYEQITREQLAEVIAYVCAMEAKQRALHNDNGEYCSVNKEQLLWVLNLPLHIQQETCLLDGIDFSKSSGKILMRRLTDKIDGYLKGYTEKSMKMLCAADPIFARTMRGLDAAKAQAS